MSKSQDNLYTNAIFCLPFEAGRRAGGITCSEEKREAKEWNLLGRPAPSSCSELVSVRFINVYTLLYHFFFVKWDIYCYSLPISNSLALYRLSLSFVSMPSKKICTKSIVEKMGSMSLFNDTVLKCLYK